MFNLSGSEIIVILLLALVVLGPEKLPEAMRKFGKTYGEFRRMTTGFQQEFKSAIDEPMREMRETADLLRHSADLGALEAEQEAALRDAEKSRVDKPVSPGGPADTTPVDTAPADTSGDAAAADAADAADTAPVDATPADTTGEPAPDDPAEDRPE